MWCNDLYLGTQDSPSVNNSGNFDMLYMHISRSDLSSAALKPKYLEDKTQNIEIREALNIPKHSKKDSQIQNRGDEPVQYMETTLGVFIHFFKNLDTGNFINI